MRHPAYHVILIAYRSVHWPVVNCGFATAITDLMKINPHLNSEHLKYKFNTHNFALTQTTGTWLHRTLYVVCLLMISCHEGYMISISMYVYYTAVCHEKNDS